MKALYSFDKCRQHYEWTFCTHCHPLSTVAAPAAWPLSIPWSHPATVCADDLVFCSLALVSVLCLFLDLLGIDKWPKQFSLRYLIRPCKAAFGQHFWALPHLLHDPCTKCLLISDRTAFQMPWCFPVTNPGLRWVHMVFVKDNYYTDEEPFLVHLLHIMPPCLLLLMTSAVAFGGNYQIFNIFICN